MRVLGSSPKLSAQPQNIFVRVSSWTWISSPMTGSQLASCATPAVDVEADRLLERVRGVEHAVLAERRAGELEADRQALGRARWGSRSPGMPASDIGTVQKSLRYIASGSAVLAPSSKATPGRGRRDDEVEPLPRVVEVLREISVRTFCARP